MGMQPTGDCAVGELDLSSKRSVTITERWTRDLKKPQPGEALSMRLLFRYGMLEMYVNDVLYPIYSMHIGDGRIGITNASALQSAKRWSLPAENTASVKSHAREILV